MALLKKNIMADKGDSEMGKHYFLFICLLSRLLIKAALNNIY